MRINVWAALTLAMTALSPMLVEAQVNTSLTDKDRAEITAMSVTYRRALIGCKAEEYANLFATPGGYFSSSSRGEVREREALMEMVLGYDRCHSAAAAAAEAPRATASLPTPVIEPSPEGAKARIINSRGGGYYDDVYEKTGPGQWRIKSRTTVKP